MDKHIASEAGLLQASINGNSAAFESIVRKYQGLICAITYSATSDIEKSEELAQETFVRAWKNLKQLKDLSSFRAWLCTIARTTVKNHFRSQNRDLLHKAGSLDNAAAESSDTADPADNLVSMEEQTVVAKALQDIPESYRQPLILFYRQEKSVKQVAELLELSEDNVRTRLSRGRKMLKEQVAAMVEKTLANTAPGKAFTVCVMASVAGIAMKTSAVAATAAAATTGIPAAAPSAAVMSAITAKIITAAAVIVIAVAAVVTYKQITKPSPKPEFSRAGIVVQEQVDEQKKITEEVTALPNDETKGLSAIDTTTKNLDSKESGGSTTEIMQKADKNNSTVSDDNLIVGGFIKSEDGEPIAGVDVKLLWDVIRGNMPMNDSSKAVTDPNGRWQCQITGESEDILIRLKHPDYLAKFFSYRPSFENLIEKTAVLIMKKGMVVAGYVHDTQGNPVANALIMPPRSITSTSGKHGIQDSAKTARTDDDGVFLLKAVELGLQDIAVDAKGYAPAFVSVNVIEETPPIEITLDHGQDLTGVVVGIDGKPISGVEIKIDEWQIIQGKDTNNFNYKQFKILRRQASSDAQGQYIIKHLPPIGDVNILFAKRPHHLISNIKNNMAKNKTKSVTMFPIPKITGAVIDADSEKSITEFKVTIGCTWDPNSKGSWHSKTKKITSPQGNFSRTKSNFCAGELPSPGWVAARVSAKGYYPAQSSWMRIDQEFLPITISLKKAQVLSSTLLYSDGVAVSNTDVILIEPSSWVQVRNGKLDEAIINCQYRVTKTDTNGYFEFSAPSAPTKILVLDYDEYVVADTNDLKDMLTMAPWAYVIGSVDTGNETNSNIIVQIATVYDPNEQIRWMSKQTTNANGNFEFFNIPAIPQKTYYGSADSTNALNNGADINPRSNSEIELLLGTLQSVDTGEEN